VLVDDAGSLAFNLIDKTNVELQLKKINQDILKKAAETIQPSFTLDIEAAFERRNSKVVAKDNNKALTLDNLVGMDDVKKELELHVLKPLRNPLRASDYGIQVENILLHGLPGCGKTHVVSALTNSIKEILGKDKVVYMEIDSATNGGIYIHEPAGKIKAMFEAIEANINKGLFPVVFIDEIECVLKNREDAHSAEYYGEEIGLYLKGIDKLAGKALFIGATNKPKNMDPAMIRPGRIGHKIYIGPPCEHEGKQIIQYYLDKLPKDLQDPNIDVEILMLYLGLNKEGYASCDLKSIIQNASKIAFFEDKKIDQGILMKAAVAIIPGCTRLNVEAYKEDNRLFFQ
jgi:transitional endoplasmic reticulum ATPase